MKANHVGQIIKNNMLEHEFIVNDDLMAVSPVQEGHVYDGHDATGPLVLIGFLAGEPVYRTTHTVAHRMHAFFKVKNLSVTFFSVDMEKKGIFCIHWPPLFPNIWLPECEMMQLDVTIRTEV